MDEQTTTAPAEDTTTTETVVAPEAETTETPEVATDTVAPDAEETTTETPAPEAEDTTPVEVTVDVSVNGGPTETFTQQGSGGVGTTDYKTQGI